MGIILNQRKFYFHLITAIEIWFWQSDRSERKIILFFIFAMKFEKQNNNVENMNVK